MFRFHVYDFGSFFLEGLGTIYGRGCFLWPEQEDYPVIHGFGAASGSQLATHKALSEAIQRLAFLDPIEVSTEEATFEPTPDYHQEYFLHPKRRSLLAGWLSGEHFHPELASLFQRSGVVDLVDLTPDWSCPGVVVRALIAGTLPLVFGRYRPEAFPAREEHLEIHPMI
ncbi:MAG TPA: hypothetical protein VE954_31290 [Oligoflexus sp.]|uniref:hypothetical protein n=1 Tax=Oligoflexus sp. TaxID=1971216 RepID=UPI002D7116FE|nr:hypothetical protein [Oligoflexus sp.]HYX37609.1 hypothetical protein [Oligoflexus sp.]